MHPWLVPMVFAFSASSAVVHIGTCDIRIPVVVRSFEPVLCALSTFSGDRVSLTPVSDNLDHTSIVRWEFGDTGHFCDLTYADTVGWLQCETHLRVWEWTNDFTWTFDNRTLTVHNGSHARTVEVPVEWGGITVARIGPASGFYVSAINELAGGQVVQRAPNPTVCGELHTSALDRTAATHTGTVDGLASRWVFSASGGEVHTTTESLARRGCMDRRFTSVGVPMVGAAHVHQRHHVDDE